MADNTGGSACTADGQRKPLICVTPRWLEIPRFPMMPDQIAPHEAAANVQMDAIIAAGGLPLMMPLTTDRGLMREYVAMCDGFSMPGGQDVNPRLWGSDEEVDPSLLCAERDAFDYPFLEEVLAAHKPLFTICRGTQMLNVVCGGTLCMEVTRRTPRAGMANWRHTGILNGVAHEVEVREDTLLSRCVGGARTIQVNSSHHCCVERLGTGLELVGEATDGMPEAVEMPGEPFVLGVQWHPEYTWSYVQTDRMLWDAFIAACR